MWSTIVPIVVKDLKIDPGYKTKSEINNKVDWHDFNVVNHFRE